MYKKIIIRCMMAAFILSACVEKEELPQEQESLQFGAVAAPSEVIDMDGDQTRTSVGEETDVTYLYWGYRESVGVYGNRTKNAKFLTTNTTPSRSVSFRGTLSWFDSAKYAYYPYNSANSSNAYTNVRSHLPIEQVFDTEARELTFDFKAATVTTSGWNNTTYNFTNLMTYLRLLVNATGTELEGDKLESITFRAPEGRSFGGDFSIDLGSQEITWGAAPENANEITVSIPNNPVLGKDVTEVIYITCAPACIQAGDSYQIIIRTDNHIATINKSLSKTLQGNVTYKNTLTLANLDMTVRSRMTIENFSFEATDNVGKILSKEVYFNGSNSVNRSITEQKLNVNESDYTISGVIPYLFDFSLVPTFTTTGNADVYHNGTLVESGKTEIDFSVPVTLELRSGEDVKEYTVEVKNTGLPVVVLTQGTAGTVSWNGPGIKVKAKDSEWVDTDKIAVYNADGTVNLEQAACGFRLRGNTTQTFPKKPFAIKLAKKANLLDIMPDGGKHKRWCLLANYIDRSLMRNAITNELANLTIDAWKNTDSAPGLIWNPSGKNVELVIDGVHVGNYYLTEQIKIDEGRLNILPPYEDVVEDGNANPTIADCGYLLEFDDAFDETENGQFVTKRYLPVMFKDYTPEAIRNEIRTKIDNIETNLKKNTEAGFEAAFADLDINSVIDWWFIHELAMNDEFKHPKSVYMYINGAGKLSAGPVWDFDYQTYPNVDGITEIYNAYRSKSPRPGTYGLSVSKWLYSNENAKSSTSFPTSPTYTSERGNADKPYMWYPWLFKSTEFRAMVQERWQIIKPYWLDIYSRITLIGESNALSETYNFAMWPLESKDRQSIRNANGVNWFVDFSGDERIEDWEGVIENFRNVFTERLEEMDRMITSGDFYPSISSGSGSGSTGSGSGSGNWWDNWWN